MEEGGQAFLAKNAIGNAESKGGGEERKYEQCNDLVLILGICYRRPYLFKVSTNGIVKDTLTVGFIHHDKGIHLFQQQRKKSNKIFCLSFRDFFKKEI